ncbi:MAG: hypothetical protein JO273_22625 [Methylobacteriaceae bacterium]|nr:hypothetical protein [Methylobacteriaceae bacterium]MBV9634144.1 hypothetical protein [Methylobacteriaceae bacterium]
MKTAKQLSSCSRHEPARTAARLQWALAGVLLVGATGLAFAQEAEIAPAPPSIGADVPATYFGPAPSSHQRELVGPYQVLRSGKVDLDKGTVTLPLYEGAMKGGETVWYIVTDTDDKGNADQLGLNYSPKLTFADVGRAVRKATLNNKFKLVFEAGKVDFSPNRSAVPGDAPNYFPPKKFQPGSVGDKDYSPLVKILNAGGHIYNAPIIAFNVSAEKLNQFCDGNPDYSVVHDKVVKICPRDQTVTLALTTGFSFAKPVLYLSTDTNNPLTATAEGATYAPGLEDIQGGGDDSLFSPVERIFVFVNGPTGKDNPQRQGLNSALADGASPLNVLGGIPTVATDYSPIWDLNPAVWTQKAIDMGYRSRLTEEFAILGFVQKGWLTGINGKPFGSVGFVVNCPIVYRFL